MAARAGQIQPPQWLKVPIRLETQRRGRRRPPRGRIFVSGMSRGSTDASSMDMSQGAMHIPSFRIVICSLAGLDAVELPNVRKKQCFFVKTLFLPKTLRIETP